MTDKARKLSIADPEMLASPPPVLRSEDRELYDKIKDRFIACFCARGCPLEWHLKNRLISFVVGVITGAIAVVAFAGWARTPVAHESPSRLLPSRDGWTQREAIANLHDAIAEWIADARSMDRPVPEPKCCVAA
jgi:hypothetical protein